MKIRIGVGAGGALSTPGVLAELVTGLDRLGFDSLWLSEGLTAPVLDPVVGLAWAAASNPRLKLGDRKSTRLKSSHVRNSYARFLFAKQTSMAVARPPDYS